MTMRRITLLLLAVLWATIAGAQQTLSLKDAIIGRYTYLNPEMPSQVIWKDARSYIMPEKSGLVAFNLKNDEKQELTNIKILNTALLKVKIPPLENIPEIALTAPNRIQFTHSGRILTFNTDSREVEQQLVVPENAENTDYCRATNQIAYTVGNNLFIAGKEITQVTNDPNPEVVYGQSVHRHEFSTDKGTFWSPEGNFLAFYRNDQTHVKDYPLVDYMTREAALKNIKYPMAGMESERVSIGIFSPATGKTIYLETVADDHYLTNISWAPDEASIFVFELNRDQDHLRLNQYNAQTGKFIKTLFDEKSKTYVEPTHPLLFSKTDPDKFYYLSRKDGWYHVYLYSTSGGQIRQITRGNWEVTEILGFDPDEKNLFFEATKDSPVERHIYKIGINSGKITRLTSEPGVHHGLLSPDGEHVIDRWSGTNVPGRIDLVSSKGELDRTIFTANDTMKDFDLGENTVFTIKAADGKTDLYCRMIKPNNFDPLKKYPVIVYVYGGPHVQLINKTWHNDIRGWEYYMASKGFIAFTVDSRGSDNRGKAFEEVTHGRLGIVETEDQMKGIEYLKSLPYVDSDRIGVHGWSFGGFMTLNLMLRHPEVFKVGVAGGPVVDWGMYEIMYGERYMDRPEENPEGYKNSNMLNYIQNLNGKLMLIHGVQDDTVVMQHSMKFLQKCIELGKQVDFFVYPTHPHNVRGIDRVHLMEKISNYFIDNL